MAVVLTNAGWRTVLLTMPAQLLYEGVHLVFSAARGHLGAWFAGKWALLRLLPSVWRWRRQVQRRRRVSDSELLCADPLTMHPGIAERGAAATVRRALDGFYRGWWRMTRVLCR